jgi:hypothetical protein
MVKGYVMGGLCRPLFSPVSFFRILILEDHRSNLRIVLAGTLSAPFRAALKAWKGFVFTKAAQILTLYYILQETLFQFTRNTISRYRDY